tara:strand:+ start:1497 stop:1820 length:324 start_codon:yes stop_codon:yes gene_type:complete
MKNVSIIRKLRKERKLPEEAEVFVSNISLEDLIALKLEIAGKCVNGKLYGIPIWKAVPFIVREALLKAAISVCKTKHESASFLGIHPDKLDRLLRKYKIVSFFEETD